MSVTVWPRWLKPTPPWSTTGQYRPSPGGRSHRGARALARFVPGAVRVVTGPMAGDTATAVDIERILTGLRVWAVVGCSADPGRPSHRVARFLQSHGYRVIPVNPAIQG